MNQRTPTSVIEILEPRVAPASIIGNVLIYQDVGGGHVTLTFSKGPITMSDFTFSAGTVAGTQQLQEINIAGQTGLSRANITLSVKGGDGLAPVGYLDAAGVDLGAVTIHGDLGRISAGSNAPSNVAIKTLKIQSAGLYGTATQPTGGTLASSIQGSLGSLVVAGDVQGITLDVSDSTTGANGTIGSVSIGGSLFGGATIESTTASLGTAKIGGSINSGCEILGQAALGTVTVGLNLAGDITSGSGNIAAVKIGGSIDSTAAVSGHTGVELVTVGHDLIGTITSDAGKLGVVRIGGSLNGGTVESEGSITAVTIGHSVVDSDILAGTTGTPGAITIGAIAVKGNWIASSVSAGVEQTGDGYGNTDNVLIATSSNIASITIGGIIAGNTAASPDHFGFDAQRIGSFNLTGEKITLPFAPGTVPLSPETGDVAIVLLT